MLGNNANSVKGKANANANQTYLLLVLPSRHLLLLVQEEVLLLVLYKRMTPKKSECHQEDGKQACCCCFYCRLHFPTMLATEFRTSPKKLNANTTNIRKKKMLNLVRFVASSFSFCGRTGLL